MTKDQRLTIKDQKPPTRHSELVSESQKYRENDKRDTSSNQFLPF